MIGNVYGRLTVLSKNKNTKWGEITWNCACTCGKTKIVKGKSLRAGITQSCGCLFREKALAMRTTHGMRHSPEYSSWVSMKSRCYNPKNKDYKKYGARGIVVYDPWKKSFDAFYKHIGPRPKDTSLDRIDGKKGYIPGNVRWATLAVQNRNRYDAVFVTTKNGDRLHITDVAKLLGITRGAAAMRNRRGNLHV